MANTCLVILCGVPGVGKTYFAKHLKNRKESNGLKPTFIIVEYDRLLPHDLEKILIQSDDHQQSKWKSYRADIVKCVDYLLECMQKCCHGDERSTLQNEPPEDVSKELWEKFKCMIIDSDFSWPPDDGSIFYILIDDNMYYRSMRYSYYQLARKYETGFCQIYLDNKIETAISQNASRAVKVTDDVIFAMATKMEVPDSTKSSWEENSIIVSPGDDTEPVFALLRKALSSPVQPVEEEDTEQQEQSRVICSENFLYQSDQILRRLVSQQMTSAKERSLTKSDMKSLAGLLQTARKRLIEDLKSGLICMPTDLVTMVTDSSKDTNSAVYQFLEEKFDIYLKNIKR